MTSPIHRCIRGDSMKHLGKIPTESVDLVCTDPPYGVGYVSTLGESIANDERPYIWWLGEAGRIVKPGGAILCFTRWDVQEIFRAAIECAGFRVRSQLVWDKRANGMGDTTAQFAPNHEVVWFATKGRFRFPGPRPGSVLTETRPDNARRTHPTEKPVGLLTDLITATTERGALVVDPFMGTGSCGVACVRTNRRFVGIELSGRYCGKARQRIAESRGSGTLYAGCEQGSLIEV